MANKDVETKVVQVRFDNSKFSKNVEKTIKQCEKLDKSLEFKNRSKDIKEVQEAIDKVQTKELNKELEKTDSIVHKITLGFKDLLKLKVLSRVMDTVINRTSALTKNLLGIKNVLAGWQQYEEQVTNVGGILNQVEKKTKEDGTLYGLNDVADAMKRLQWYTDETSFNFTTLSNGIRQFVVAGIDLNKAAEAAMGVTNLAGSAKVFDEYKIQSAMNAVSKAMQAGYMDLQKWTTLSQTAGIVTEDFSKALIEEAYAQGKLVKSAGGQYRTKKGGKLVTEENIASTLSQKWLNSNILTKVMNRYSSASTAVETFTGLMAEQTDESLQKINELFKESGVQFTSFEEILAKMPEDITDSTDFSAEQAARYLEKLGYQFDELSLKSFKSSQETTSFSQALNYVAGTVRTKWAGIFQSIFGDYDTATRLWSDVSNKFYNIFISPFQHLSDTFEKWSTLSEGGAEDFRSIILTLIDIVGKFKDSVGEAFGEVFGEANESWLQRITLALKKFFESIKNNEALFDGIKAFFKILASVLKITSKLSGAVLKIIVKLLIALEPLADLVAKLLGWLADGITWLINYVDELGILDGVVEGLSWVLKKLGDGIKKAVEWIKGKVDLKKVLEGIAKAIDWIKESIKKLIDKIKEAYEATKKWVEENEFFQTIADAYSRTTKKIKSAFVNFGESAKEASDGIKQLNKSGEGFAKGRSVLDKIIEYFKKFVEFIKATFLKLVDFLNKTGILPAIQGILLPIIDTIRNWFKRLGELAKENPQEALKTIINVIKMVLSIIILFNVINLIRNANAGLQEFWEILHNFKKKIVAEKWKAMAKSLLYISAAVGIIALTINMLSRLDTKKALAALYMVIAIIGMFTLVLLMMDRSKGSFKYGVSSALMAAATAIAVSLFVGRIKTILKLLDGYSAKSIWTAMGILAAMIGAWCLILFTSFRKVETEWVIKKSGKVVGPGLFSLIKTMLAVFVFLKMAIWFINKTKDIDEKAFIRTGSILVGLLMSLAFIIYSFNSFKMKIENSNIFINTASVISSIMEIALLAMVAFYILKEGSKINEEDIKKGTKVLTTVLIFISILFIEMAVTSAIINKKSPGTLAVGISKNVWFVIGTILITVFAIKQLKSIPVKDMWKAVGVISVIYAAITAMIAIISLTSKQVVTIINKQNGFARASNKSPIVNAIYAIALTVLLMLAAIYIVNKIDIKEFWIGFGKVSAILGLAIAFIITTMLLCKKIDKKEIAMFILSVFGSIVVLIYSILGAVKLIQLIGYGELAAGLGFIVAILAMTLGYMKLMAMIVKNLSKDMAPIFLKSTNITIGLIMAEAVAIIFAMIGAIYLLNEINISPGRMLLSLAAIAAILTAVAVFTRIYVSCINSIQDLKVDKFKTVALSTAVLFGVISLFIAAVVSAIAMIDIIGPGAVAGGLLTIGVILTTIVIMIKQYAKTLNNIKKDSKDVLTNTGSLALALGSIMISVFAIIGVIALLNKYFSDFASLAIAYGEFVVLMGTIVGMLALYALDLKIIKKESNAVASQTKSLIIALGSMIIGVYAAIGIIKLLEPITVPIIWKAMGVIAVMMTMIILAIGGFAHVINVLKKTDDLAKNTLKLFMTIGLMTVALYGIIGAIAWVATMNWQKARLGAGIVAAIMTAITLVIVAIVVTLDHMKNLDTVKLLPNMLAISGLIVAIGLAVLGIAFGIYLLGSIEVNALNRAVVVVGAIIGVIILILAGIVILTTKLPEMKKELANMAMFGLTLLMIAASIFIIIGAIWLAGKLTDDTEKLKNSVDLVVGSIFLCVGTLFGLAKIANVAQQNTADFAKLGLAMLAISASVIIIIGALWLAGKLTDDAEKLKNSVIIVIGVIIMCLLTIYGLSKLVDTVEASVKDISKMGLLMAMIAGSILLIVLSLWLVTKIDDKKLPLALKTVGIIMVALIGLVAIVSALGNKIGNAGGAYLKLGGMILMFVGAIVAIIGALFLLSLIKGNIWDYLKILGVIAAGLVVAIAAIMAISKWLNKEGNWSGFGKSLIALAAIIAAIVLVALSLKMLASVDQEKMRTAAITIGILMGAMIALLVVLSLLVNIPLIGQGIQAAVAIFIGVSAALLMIGAAIYLVAKAIETLVNSFIKLSTYMASKTPAQAIEDFKSASIQAASATLNFRTALTNLGSACVNLTTSGLNLLTSAIDRISASMKSSGDKKIAEGLMAKAEAYKVLADSLTIIQNINTGKIGENLEWFDKFFGAMETGNIEKFKDLLYQLDTALVFMSDNLFGGTRFKTIKEIFTLIYMTLESLNKVLSNGLMELLYNIEYILTLYNDIENPVITPVFDMSQFDAGIEYMRQNLSKYAYAYRSDAANVDSISKMYNPFNFKSKWYEDLWNKNHGEQIVINQNYTLTDFMSYGYDSMRAAKNSIDAAYNFIKR